MSIRAGREQALQNEQHHNNDKRFELETVSLGTPILLWSSISEFTYFSTGGPTPFPRHNLDVLESRAGKTDFLYGHFVRVFKFRKPQD